MDIFLSFKPYAVKNNMTYKNDYHKGKTVGVIKRTRWVKAEKKQD